MLVIFAQLIRSLRIPSPARHRGSRFSTPVTYTMIPDSTHVLTFKIGLTRKIHSCNNAHLSRHLLVHIGATRRSIDLAHLFLAALVVRTLSILLNSSLTDSNSPGFPATEFSESIDQGSSSRAAAATCSVELWCKYWASSTTAASGTGFVRVCTGEQSLGHNRRGSDRERCEARVLGIRDEEGKSLVQDGC